MTMVERIAAVVRQHGKPMTSAMIAERMRRPLAGRGAMGGQISRAHSCGFLKVHRVDHSNGATYWWDIGDKARQA